MQSSTAVPCDHCLENTPADTSSQRPKGSPATRRGAWQRRCPNTRSPTLAPPAFSRITTSSEPPSRTCVQQEHVVPVTVVRVDAPADVSACGRWRYERQLRLDWGFAPSPIRRAHDEKRSNALVGVCSVHRHHEWIALSCRGAENVHPGRAPGLRVMVGRLC